MKTADSQVIPAPPNLIQTLMAGFDTVTNHLGLIVFSVLLDIFLWFGPHLRLAPIVKAYFEAMSHFPDITGEMKTGQELLTAVAERFNLFSALRSFPVGIPSLISSQPPLTVPGGKPLILDIASPGLAVGLWLLLTVVGLLCGTLYFSVVAQAALMGRVSWRQALEGWPWAAVQVVLLAVFWAGVLIAATVPFLCAFSLLLLMSINLGSGVFLFYAALVVWLLVPLIFSPLGIFVYRRNTWASIKEGVRLMRMTLPSTGLFLLFVLVLSQGLDLLWLVPAEDSWLRLVGVAGHAFVTTGLLAAAFIYYHQASQWVQRMIQQAKLAAMGK